MFGNKIRKASGRLAVFVVELVLYETNDRKRKRNQRDAKRNGILKKSFAAVFCAFIKATARITDSFIFKFSFYAIFLKSVRS